MTITRGPGMENPHPVDGVAADSLHGLPRGQPRRARCRFLVTCAAPARNRGPGFSRPKRVRLLQPADANRLGSACRTIRSTASEYTALDYMQFINPGGSARVASRRPRLRRMPCRAMWSAFDPKHGGHLDWRLFSGASFAIGADNQVPGNQGLWQQTAADLVFPCLYSQRGLRHRPRQGRRGAKS